jgi:hypothetical protein
MTREVTIEDKTYKISPIRVGQMRDAAMIRQTEPNRSVVDDNIDTVLYCLQNGGEQVSRKDIEEMAWGTYRQLVEICSEVSGFTSKELKPGEEAQVAPLTGPGSTAVSRAD